MNRGELAEELGISVSDLIVAASEAGIEPPGEDDELDEETVELIREHAIRERAGELRSDAAAPIDSAEWPPRADLSTDEAEVGGGPPGGAGAKDAYNAVGASRRELTWRELRRRHSRKKVFQKRRDLAIGIIGMSGSGKSAYLYVLGRHAESQTLGSWSFGPRSQEYAEFLTEKHQQLDNWQKTDPGDIPIQYRLFTLTRKNGLKAEKVAVESFDCSGELWRQAFLPGYARQANVTDFTAINTLRTMAAECAGYLILLDAELAGVFFDRMAVLESGEEEGRIYRPVAFALTKADLFALGVDAREDELELYDLLMLRRDPDRREEYERERGASLPARMEAASRFVAKYLPSIHARTKKVRRAAFFSLSCWGRPPEEVSTRVKVGRSIYPVGVGEPLEWVIEQVVEERKRYRKARRVRRLAVALILLAVLIPTVFGLCIWSAGLAAEQGQPDWGKQILIAARRNPVAMLPWARSHLRSAYGMVADGYLRRALTAFRSGNNATASPAFESAFRMASCAGAAGAPVLAEAIEGLVDVAGRTPCDSDVLERVLRTVRQAGQFDTSDLVSSFTACRLAEVDKALLAARIPEAVELLAKLWTDLEKLEIGAPHLDRVREQCLQIYRKNTLRLRHAGLHQQALLLCRSMPATVREGAAGPDADLLEAETRITYGRWLASQQGQQDALQQADTEFRQAVALAPDLDAATSAVPSFISASRVAAQSGRFERAEEAIEYATKWGNTERHAAAIFSCRQDVAGYVQTAAERSVKNGELEEGVKLFDIMARISGPREVADPAFIVFATQALTLAMDDQAGAAEECLDYARTYDASQQSSLMPTIEAVVLVEKAKNLLSTGRPTDALKTLESALEHDPRSLDAKSLKQHVESVSGMTFVPFVGSSKGFYMDSFEVSNEEYARRRGVAVRCSEYSPHPRSPVVEVDWGQAREHAAAIGKRLPSRQEWECAFGTHTYPWGDTWRKGGANTSELRVGKALPPGDLQMERDVSPCGVRYLAGNVSEWTSDRGTTESGQRGRIAMGGDWLSPLANATRTRSRVYVESKTDVNLGFRCACDAVPERARQSDVGTALYRALMASLERMRSRRASTARDARP